MSSKSSNGMSMKPSLFTSHEQLVIHQCALWLLAEDEKRLRMLLNETADVKLQAKTHLLNADSFLKKEIDACEMRLLEMEQKDEDLRHQLDDATNALHLARQNAQENAESEYNPRHHIRNLDVPYSPSVNNAQHKVNESHGVLSRVADACPLYVASCSFPISLLTPSYLLPTARTQGKRSPAVADLAQARARDPAQRPPLHVPHAAPRGLFHRVPTRQQRR